MRNALKILCLFVIQTSYAQLGVGMDTMTVVENGKVLKLAWAGGLNTCMFSSMDVNQDGKPDIVVFDKVNTFSFGAFRCFINKTSTSGQMSYEYDGRYTNKFPSVMNWAVFIDYDKDGRADLFTYTTGGTKVYRNMSTGGNLSFQISKYILQSNTTPTSSPTYAPMFASIYAAPAFSDVDNDGDLDMLNFSAFGLQIEYHKNMSKEAYGIIDSLIYQLDETTWGDVSESSCNVSLNQYIISGTPGDHAEKVMHAGSCLMCFDRDGDGDKDLLMGDITCSGNTMNYCENGGTPTAAHIIDTTKLYPNFPAKGNTQTIKISNFPCAYNLDVDNDNKKDLIACPNNLSSENFQSVWLYKNVSSTSIANFQFVKNNFLQDDMIELGEGAFPVLFDVDNDGLQDLVIGNLGYYLVSNKSRLAYYRNTGTLTQPTYSLITKDFLSLSTTTINQLGFVPTFGDIDSDGDKDMILADHYGAFHWIENTAGAGNPCNFSNLKANYFALSPVPSAAYPQLIDVNRDGLLDLLVGTRNGRLSYYINSGTGAAPSFSLVTSTFGNVNVKGPASIYGADGSCAPFMYDVAGSYKLLCGSISGQIYSYDNIDGNLSGNFTLVDTCVNKINDGPRTGLQFVDINGDAKRDLIIGNYAGGLSFYSSKSTIGINETEADDDFVKIYPNPANDQLHIRAGNFIERVEIKMNDITGREVLTASVNSSVVALDCSGFPHGIYLVQINCYQNKNSRTLFKKIIIQ